MERAGLKSSALTPRPLPPGTWPKASDEADGNTGRPQPGFFRITGTKYFVLYRSQAQNISYSIDHRQKIRILPKRYFGLYLLVGGRKRLVFSGSHLKNTFIAQPCGYFLGINVLLLLWLLSLWACGQRSSRCPSCPQRYDCASA